MSLLCQCILKTSLLAPLQVQLPCLTPSCVETAATSVGKVSVEKGQKRVAGEERNTGTRACKGCNSSNQEVRSERAVLWAPKCRNKLYACPHSGFLGAVDSRKLSSSFGMLFGSPTSKSFVCFLPREQLFSLGACFFQVRLLVGWQKLCESVVWKLRQKEVRYSWLHRAVSDLGDKRHSRWKMCAVMRNTFGRFHSFETLAGVERERKLAYQNVRYLLTEWVIWI